MHTHISRNSNNFGMMRTEVIPLREDEAILEVKVED